MSAGGCHVSQKNKLRKLAQVWKLDNRPGGGQLYAHRSDRPLELSFLGVPVCFQYSLHLAEVCARRLSLLGCWRFLIIILGRTLVSLCVPGDSCSGRCWFGSPMMEKW